MKKLFLTQWTLVKIYVQTVEGNTITVEKFVNAENSGLTDFKIGENVELHLSQTGEVLSISHRWQSKPRTTPEVSPQKRIRN